MEEQNSTEQVSYNVVKSFMNEDYYFYTPEFSLDISSIFKIVQYDYLETILVKTPKHIQGPENKQTIYHLCVIITRSSL